MPSYNIGLDFGTHQTKICLEDSSDRRNKRYFFNQFPDDIGNLQYTIPSVVMVKKDRTLGYGYVDENESLLACIAPLTEEPVKPELVLWSYPPKPKLPDIPEKPNPPLPPDFNEIEAHFPKPTEPKMPVLQYNPERKEEHLVFNDLSELVTLREEKPASQQATKDFSKLMIEYRQAVERYKKQLKTYNYRLKKAKSKAYHLYEEKMYEYRIRIEMYDTIQKKRESQIYAYEKQCQEVDWHNKKCQEQIGYRIAEYEKARQQWDEERKKPQPIVMRYFKQALFSSGLVWRYEWSPMLVSIWFLTFVFFDLDEKYGTENLTVCMGTSSGVHTWGKNKEVATQVLLTVYHIIEDVFHHDRQAFLQCTVDDLMRLTDIVPYSDEAKFRNGIFVFPEAYANLNPMALDGKFGTGMNIVIDIGGGTTDISLFSAFRHNKETKLEIYDYISIPYGLNAVRDLGEDCHKSAVSLNVSKIVGRIEAHARNIGVPENEISRVLQKRPVVFTGGGSTLNNLCCGYAGFSDIKHLRDNVGVGILIEDRQRVFELMAILSTALGLAMCPNKDNEIKLLTIQELFKEVEEAYIDKQLKNNRDNYIHGVSDWE